MLNDRGHNNLWLRTSRENDDHSALNRDETADVAIIGAGYTGLSTALHLAERGLKPVVVEAAGIGHGGSGRNVGLVNAGMWVKPMDLIETQGEEWGHRLISALGDGPRLVFDLIERFDMACEPLQNGTLHLAVGDKGLSELRDRETQWQALGAPVNLLDAGETASLTGTNAFPGALHDARAGTVQPLAYARGLARAATEAGAQIFTHSPATRVEKRNGQWRVQTPGGVVKATWLVVATNAYADPAQPGLLAAPMQELTILPFFQFATAPLPEDIARRILPERHGCWDTRMILTSLRRDQDNRLIFGSVGSLEMWSDAAQQAFARRTLKQLFPFLGEISFEAKWQGQIGMTKSHLPRFHMFAEKAIGVCGFNGRGIAPGTVFGKQMAAYIAGGEELALPLTPVEPAGLARQRTLFYRLGSCAAHLVSARG
ncbi:NAD(P)/FAD-dependent oxidoreductase [Cucumibacter marinus]|uniref:NAD(P)/FAD-dependent oxidoreductase n=1 Tax=Cucumibacter marinus TaxID=1121252 RepID=UPI0004208732|nr:FAD-binding oxidoreductase [Cucumibacter marinus]